MNCLYRHAFHWDCLEYYDYLPATLSVTSSNTSRLHPSNPPQSSPTRAGCPLASFSSPGFPPFLINNHEPIPNPSTSSTRNHLANTLYHSHTPSEVPQRQELHRTDAGGVSPQPGYSRPLEHQFRNSLLPVLQPFANGFTAFVSLEEERRTHEQTLFQLTNPRITATDEVKLNVLSSSPPASHPPLDTVTPSANCHDKESVPPFTQSTLKDSWTIIPNCLCAKKQNHPPLFIRTLSVSSATP